MNPIWGGNLRASVRLPKSFQATPSILVRSLRGSIRMRMKQGFSRVDKKPQVLHLDRAAAGGGESLVRIQWNGIFRGFQGVQC
ncbi:MAG TPA: hypothetical protein DCR20_10965 [Planctomycetaceae bacterium]|nr:hypothetical protein [Planctomycetaceae bacterium]